MQEPGAADAKAFSIAIVTDMVITVWHYEEFEEYEEIFRVVPMVTDYCVLYGMEAVCQTGHM